MSSLSEKIEELKKQITAKEDELRSLTQKMAEDEEDETLAPQVNDAAAWVNKAKERLQTFLNTEKALAEKAVAAPAIVTSTGPSKDAEELFVKQGVVSFLAHVQRKSPEQIIAERYSTNKALQAVQKTAVPIATTFTTGWAAELVQQDVRGFMNLLVPTSVVAALAQRSLMLSFDGYDSIKLPRRGARGARGANMGGAFVGESGAIPLGQMSIESSTLSRYKMAIISTFSRELAQRSTPAIEQVIRQAILDDTSIELDAAFLSSAAAVTGVRPAGALLGAATAAGTTGGGIDAVVADVKGMLASLMSAGLGERPVLLVNSNTALSVAMLSTGLGEMMFRDEIAGGRLLGIEIVKSLNVAPATTAILVDAAALAIVLDAYEFDVSDVATVVEANSDTTSPSHDNGTAGQVDRNGGLFANTAVANAKARSLWQHWSVGVRMVHPLSWGFMRPNAVVTRTAITW